MNMEEAVADPTTHCSIGLDTGEENQYNSMKTLSSLKSSLSMLVLQLS